MADPDGQPDYPAYQRALEAAKAEHDTLEPKLQKMVERRAALRNVIRGCSTLLGVELEEKYDWRVQIEQARGIVRKAGKRS